MPLKIRITPDVLYGIHHVLNAMKLHCAKTGHRHVHCSQVATIVVMGNIMQAAMFVVEKLSIHNTLINPQIRCFRANIIWLPSSLPCLRIFSIM